MPIAMPRATLKRGWPRLSARGAPAAAPASIPNTAVRMLPVIATDPEVYPSLGDTVFVPQTTGYVKSVDFHAREGQAPSGRLFLTGADHHQPTGKAQKPSLPCGIALGTRQSGRLGFDYLLRLASVGCAASLSFARVFTRMLATALALAVVLTFARVFR